MALQRVSYLRTIDRPEFNLRDVECGAVADDSTNASAAINAYVATIAMGGPAEIVIDRAYYTPATLNLSYSNIRYVFKGAGRLRGDGSFVGSGDPEPITRMNFHGALSGSPLGYTTAIGGSTSTFGIASSGLSVNSFVLLQNFPTDSTTDAFTYPSSTDHGQRLYNVGAHGSTNFIVDAANKRQFRRRECLQIQAVTGSDFTSFSPCVYDYSTYHTSADALQFQPYTPVSNVHLVNANLQDIYVQPDLTANFRCTSPRLYRATIAGSRSLYPQVTDAFLDAQNVDAYIGFGQSSRFITITGIGQGGLIGSDNALFRSDQSANFLLVLNTSGTASGVVGCIIDTNYAEAPDGYCDVPTLTGQVYQVHSGKTMALFATCDPYAANISGLMMNVSVGGASSPQGIYLKGVGASTLFCNAQSTSLRLDACNGLNLYGAYTSIFPGTLADPRNPGSTVANASIKTPTLTTLY